MVVATFLVDFLIHEFWDKASWEYRKILIDIVFPSLNRLTMDIDRRLKE